MLTDIIKSKIKKHSLEFPNEEVCGFILDDNDIFRARNVSCLKHKTFSIHPLDYIEAEKENKIAAVYHSHAKNKNFSEFDKVNSTNHNKIYVMYCLETDEFNVFYPSDYSNKYIGRKFDYKTNNCFSLIFDFYKNELNTIIAANIPEMDEKWYLSNKNLILDNLNKSNQFNILDNWKYNISKNDIILFNYTNINGPPHHIGLYVEDGIFLHHPRYQFSKMEIFDKFFQNKVTHVIRLKS
jgi:proteasome lid subunit RPN8/RPN11